jgi:hypothetical protein
MGDDLLKRLGNLNLDSKPDTPNKFEEFLRKTTSFRSLKNVNPGFLEDSPSNSKAGYIKPETEN